MLEARALRLESVEKCDHTKAHITEIMNLSMSLNGDYLTDQLKLLAALKMWFDPVSFVCTHNGMNWAFEMPQIYWTLKFGYLGSWMFFIGWSICVFLYFKWRRL
jgi:Mg2+ and Co2+ transporter CorA